MGMVCFKPEEQTIKLQNDISFFDLKANEFSGRRIDFYIYKKRSVFLLVNVVSNCSLAKENYMMLNELYTKYRENGLEIMAFPCNQFGKCESKSSDVIQEFLRQKHGLKFSLFENIQVNGTNTHPVYKYLRNQPLLLNKKTGKSKMIPGNFTICLLNKDGKLVRFFNPSKDFKELKKSLKRMLTYQKTNRKN